MSDSYQSGIGWNPPEPEEIDSLLDQYEVSELIGRGGMGAVYKGIQSSLERPIAIKILPPELSKQIDFAERFRREALAMAKLEHPNVVHIYDFGNEGDIYYLVMEFVEGTDLQILIRNGDLQESAALDVVGQICDALQYAHDLGYIHRDIKPANIFVSESGTVKVGDFGLAKLVDDDRDHNLPSLTQSGFRVGTPQYMAPETMQEEDSKIDHRSDIYSLGVMFYEMLTGSLPQGAFQPPSQKANVPPQLDGVVLKAMRPDPEQRYNKASDLKKKVCDISALSARKAAMDEKNGRHQPGWIIGITAVLVSLGLICFSVYQSRDSEKVHGQTNLLAGLDLNDHTLMGKWESREGEIRKLSETAMLQFPCALTGNFDLHFDFTQISQTKYILWGIPVEDRNLAVDLVAIWSSNRFRGGIGMLDGATTFTEGRQATIDTNPFSIGKRHSVSMRVRTRANVVALKVSVDRQLYFEWKGEMERLRLWDIEDLLTNMPAGTFGTVGESLGPRLYVSSGQIEIHEVRVDSGPDLPAFPIDEFPKRVITPNDSWVRFNEFIDVSEDVLVGVWDKTDEGSLQNHDSNDHVRLRLPIRVNGSYEIRSKFTHLPNSPNFHGWKLPISTGSVGFKVQERQNQWVRGLYVTNEEFAPPDKPWILPEREYTLIMKVSEKEGVLQFYAELNGQKINQWSGLLDDVFNNRLNNHRYFRAGDSDQPHIVVRKGQVEFESIDFRMLDGEATFLRPQSEPAIISK